MDSCCGGLGQVGDFLFVQIVDSGSFQMKALIATNANIEVIFDNGFFCCQVQDKWGREEHGGGAHGHPPQLHRLQGRPG